MEGRRSLMVCFFGNEVKISGSQREEKCKNKPEKKKKKKEQNHRTPKAERLVMERAGRWAQETVCVCSRPSKHMACPAVTEWALAGQQTAICKHHEGKHQSTLDFLFFFYNFFCKHLIETDPQRLSKVKKKMPFPSWHEG